MANKNIKNVLNFPWPLVKNHNELKLLTYFHDYFRYVLKMESSKYRQSCRETRTVTAVVKTKQHSANIKSAATVWIKAAGSHLNVDPRIVAAGTQEHTWAASHSSVIYNCQNFKVTIFSSGSTEYDTYRVNETIFELKKEMCHNIAWP